MRADYTSQLSAYHIISLKDLALIARTVAVHCEGGGLLAKILLRHSNTSPNGDLSTDNPIATEEGWREYMHRATFAVGHSGLSTEQFGDHTFDGSSSENSKRMTPVSSDDTVVWCDG